MILSAGHDEDANFFFVVSGSHYFADPPLSPVKKKQTGQLSENGQHDGRPNVVNV
jgi:hypothetical protein